MLRCKQRGIAMRIGTNHGSLSDRIMNRFGDTPLGMVESALEFVRICRKHDYHDLIFSMKASQPEGDDPGVPPAGGAPGRARAGTTRSTWASPRPATARTGASSRAVGIGALLDDGLGDTIRVSLTEEPEAEVPVAQRLVAPYNAGLLAAHAFDAVDERVDPYDYARRLTHPVEIGPISLGGSGSTVAVLNPVEEALGTETPDLSAVATLNGAVPWYDAVRAYRQLAATAGDQPLHLALDVDGDDLEVLLRSATVMGSLLCDGLGDSVGLTAPMAEVDRSRLLFNVLQAAGVRITKTEFVSCPSCGRTLFDLQSTTERIASRTSHLKGVKIAIMGCVVNGPGEMADADFGYVGGSPAR